MGDGRPEHLDRYLTVTEVTESARRPTARFPDVARLHRIGTSRAGRPILMLSVGHGPRHVLVVARPHPDEPVGGVTALALAEHAARGDRLSPATDPTLVTWDVVLCLDPDGAALSEGLEAATAGPGPTLAGYYRATFRPVALTSWAAGHGIPADDAERYVRGLFQAVGRALGDETRTLQRLAADHEPPGQQRTHPDHVVRPGQCRRPRQRARRPLRRPTVLGRETHPPATSRTGRAPLRTVHVSARAPSCHPSTGNTEARLQTRHTLKRHVQSRATPAKTPIQHAACSSSTSSTHAREKTRPPATATRCVHTGHSVPLSA